MEGLVGYGSSSDDESDKEQETPSRQTSNNSTVTNSSFTNGVQLSTSTSDLFPESRENAEILSKHLDISDDEENYVPVKMSNLQNMDRSNFVNPPITIPSPNPNITKLIDEAQIVSVSTDDLKTQQGMISDLLPEPKGNSVHELELEHLHKSKRRKEDKRKIFAFDLNDYLEDEEIGPKEKPKRPATSKTASGLFSILPEPQNCKIVNKSTRLVIKDKIMLTPRTIKPKSENTSKSSTNQEVVEEEKEKEGSDFFAFDKYKNDTKELESAAKSVKLDVFKPKLVSSALDLIKVKDDLRGLDSITVPQTLSAETEVQMAQEPDEVLAAVPPEFRNLAFNNSELIDVNQDIQSTDEWAIKNLDYSDDTPASSGKCPMKGQTRRKNQINYLAWQAKERESELKNQWASNRVNRHATQSKYGFR